MLDAVSERLTNAEIAARFSVSERTVETHVSALLRKLGSSNRRQLAELARAAGASGTDELPPMLLRSAQRSACIGRRSERARLLDAWARCATGQTGLTLVTGAAGIGKSRLVARAGRRRAPPQRPGAAGGGDGRRPASLSAVRRTRWPPRSSRRPEGQLRADVGRHVSPLARILPGVAARLGTIRTLQRDRPAGRAGDVAGRPRVASSPPSHAGTRPSSCSKTCTGPAPSRGRRCSTWLALEAPLPSWSS